MKKINEKQFNFECSMLNHCHHGILLLDKNLTTKYINPAAAKICGHSKKNALDKNFFNLFTFSELSNQTLFRRKINETLRLGIGFWNQEPLEIINASSRKVKYLQTTIENIEFGTPPRKWILITFFDRTYSYIPEHQILSLPVKRMTKPHTLTIQLTNTDKAWLFFASEAFPNIKFYTHSYLVDFSSNKPTEDIAISLLSFQSPKSDEIIEKIQFHPLVLSVERWDSNPNIILQVRHKNDYLGLIIRKSNVLPTFPTVTHKMKEIIQIVGTKGQILSFFTRLKENDVSFSILSTRSPQEKKNSANNLTSRQREIYRKGLDWGYFAYPRRINLTEFASKLGISTSSLSKTIQRLVVQILKMHEKPEFT